MRKIKLFALIVCTLVVLLVGEAGFVSTAWADKGGQKPSFKREHDTEYGYAILTDADDYVVWNDGVVDEYGVAVPCLDKEKGGTDRAEFEIYNDDGSLRNFLVFMGKPEEPYNSPRRVKFRFDIDSGVKTEEYYDNRAVYDILVYEADGSRRGTLINGGVWHLNDGSVHFAVIMKADQTGEVQFVVDTGNDCNNEDAITQCAVNGFYDDGDDPIYRNTITYEGCGHIIYSLYDLTFSVTPVDDATWKVKASGLAKLAVDRYSNKTGKGTCKRVYLAEGIAISFELTLVSLGPVDPPAAPGRYNTLSSTWGKIKSKL